MPRGQYERPGLLERLARYGEKRGECILWLGDLTWKGHGRIQVDGKSKRVHRLVFELAYGKTKLPIAHTCGHLACFRLEHLVVKVKRRRKPSASIVRFLNDLPSPA